MDSFCSYFIPGKALFGRYPSQKEVDLLCEYAGVTHFVDLTLEKEHLPGYNAPHIIKLPIIDGRVPRQIGFNKFVHQLIAILDNEGIIYIHCRGGHGRAGLVSACILGKYYNYSASLSLKLINDYHAQRTDMKPKTRQIGSPQTRGQKLFVRNYLEATASPLREI